MILLKIRGKEKEEKEGFYGYLNMEDVTDADCTYTKRVCKDFEIKLGEYHFLNVQSNTLWLAGVYNNSRYMCLKICGLGS